MLWLLNQQSVPGTVGDILACALPLTVDESNVMHREVLNPGQSEKPGAVFPIWGPMLAAYPSAASTVCKVTCSCGTRSRVPAWRPSMSSCRTQSSSTSRYISYSSVRITEHGCFRRQDHDTEPYMLPL